VYEGGVSSSSTAALPPVTSIESPETAPPRAARTTSFLQESRRRAVSGNKPANSPLTLVGWLGDSKLSVKMSSAETVGALVDRFCAVVGPPPALSVIGLMRGDVELGLPATLADVVDDGDELVCIVKPPRVTMMGPWEEDLWRQSYCIETDDDEESRCAEWWEVMEKALTRWVNHTLLSTGTGLLVEELFYDLADGRVLLHLVGALAHDEFRAFSAAAPAPEDALVLSLSFISQLAEIDTEAAAEGIAGGEPAAVLETVWALWLSMSGRALGVVGREAYEREILREVATRTANFGHDFTSLDQAADGTVLLALLASSDLSEYSLGKT